MVVLVIVRPPVFQRQILPNSVAQFVKFRVGICEIPKGIKRSPKNLQLDINGQFHVFAWQAANSTGNSWKSACRGILLAVVIVTAVLVVITVVCQLQC